MAASSYDEALRRLLAHEGGYSNHPSDPGGPTKYGITLADVRRYINRAATAEDVKALSLAQARAIYRTRYWDALACDRLPAGFDYALFDYGVNSGVARAVRVARALVGMHGTGGTLDDSCIAALNRADATVLIGELCDERLRFLRRLKTWSVFGRGWSRRVAEVRATALALAVGAQLAQAPQARPDAAGKGAVPLERAAQCGSASVIAASGAMLASKAHSAAAPGAVVVTILAAAVLLAGAAFAFWRWRQRRQQVTPA